MVEKGYNQDKDSDNNSPMGTSNEGNDCNDVHADKRRELGKVFLAIYNADGGSVNIPEETLARVTDPDFFRDACSILGDNILEKDFLVNRLDAFFNMRDDDFKEKFKHGTECFLYVKPTTETGSDYSRDLIAVHNYFGNASVDKDGTTRNFAWRNGPYAMAFPAEMKKESSFEIEWNEDEDGNVSSLMSSDEFIRFYNKYIDAFNALRSFFGLEPFDTGELYLTKEKYAAMAGFNGQSDAASPSLDSHNEEKPLPTVPPPSTPPPSRPTQSA